MIEPVRTDVTDVASFTVGFYASECNCDDRTNCDGSMWENPRTCVAVNKYKATKSTVVSYIHCNHISCRQI